MNERDLMRRIRESLDPEDFFELKEPVDFFGKSVLRVVTGTGQVLYVTVERG